MSLVRSPATCETLERRAYLSTIPPDPPPVDLIVSPLSTNQVLLTFTNNSPANTGFVVRRSLTGTKDWTVVAGVPRGDGRLQFIDANLDPGTTYFYRMKAVSLTGRGHFSDDIQSATTFTSSEYPFATISDFGILTIRGTADDDLISVAASGDNIVASLGELRQSFPSFTVRRINVLGHTGEDRVSVGANVPRVYIDGGEGDDTLFGGTGADRIDGGPGDDLIKGGAGNDTLMGSSGNDLIYGQDGNDFIQGADDNDKLVGGNGNDSIDGGRGNDRLYGQLGLDTLVAGGGSDRLVQ